MINLDYKTRIKLFNILNNKLRDKKDCEDNKKLLTKGGHGNIYLKKVNIEAASYEIILKVLNMDNLVMKNKFNYKFKIWRELSIFQKCNKLVLQTITQNLPLLYDYITCNNKIVFYNELAQGDLLNWLKNEHSVDEWESMIFQVWTSLYCLQKYMKLVHNDLRLPNILFHKTIPHPETSWRYIIDNEEYYLPNLGYVFVITDFGSADLLEYEKNGKKKELIKKKLELNTDLHFFHDLINRIKVLVLNNKYTTKELESFFTKPEDKNYLEKIKSEGEKRFRKSGRFDEKYKIGMIYYLIENNKFDELMNRKNNLDENIIIKMPPKQIINLLENLSKNYNYDYENIVINFKLDM